MPRLLAAVEIEHDFNGVIHIHATNEHDLFYAQVILLFNIISFSWNASSFWKKGAMSAQVNDSYFEKCFIFTIFSSIDYGKWSFIGIKKYFFFMCIFIIW